SSIKLFPQLQGKTLHRCCFFDAKEQKLLKEPIGIVLGNPPFESKLTTPGAQRSYELYQKTHGALPDRQLAYLFLHEAMSMVLACFNNTGSCTISYRWISDEHSSSVGMFAKYWTSSL